MTIQQIEAVASLKILAAIAKADGTVHNDERKSLAAALESLELTNVIEVDRLLAEDVDVAAQLATLESEEARQQLYRSAFFMAHADGTCTKEEQAILDAIEKAAGVTPEQRAALERLFAGGAGVAVTPGEKTVSDPVERAAAVQRVTLRYAVLTAVLGAFPVPGLAIVTDLAVVGLQVKLVREIGLMWGHDLDARSARSLLFGLGLGTGARLAVNNLAKLLPGWGSAVGAASSFASTYALGKVTDRYVAGGAKEDPSGLREAMTAAEAEGKAAYAENKERIAEKERETKATVEALTAEMKAGRITKEELERRVAELG